MWHILNIIYINKDGEYNFWGVFWGGRERDTSIQKNNLEIYPVFVHVWISIFTKDIAKTGDEYMKSDKKFSQHSW